MATPTEELQLHLNGVVEGLGEAVVEYVQFESGKLDTKLTLNTETVRAGLQSQIDAITKIDAEDGVETIAEKVAKINEVLSSEGVVQQILTLINSNKADILAEKTRAEKAEADIVETVTTNKTTSDNKDANLQAQIDALKGSGTGSIGNLEGRVKVVEDTLNDVTVDGVTTKGLKTKVADLGVSIVNAVAEGKAYTDSKSIVVANLDKCATVNVFRNKLNLVAKTCGDATIQPVGDGPTI
jgi:hypothetical protein